jgi:hypothetical protein
MRSAVLLFFLGWPIAMHAADDGLRAALERLAHERVFFAHQSVGANILDGVQRLAHAEGVSVRIAELPSASAVAPGTVGHFFVPENGAPLAKLENFGRALGEGSHVDVAVLKFCYADIDAGSDPAALFARYETTIEALRKANPRTVFVHVTLPLTTAQGGVKALVKRLIGRAPYGTVENVRREEYNRLLRQTYGGREPVFDLARVESTAPDGHRVTVAWNGAVAPAMAPEYTDDGGHLNAEGRRRAARALITALGAVSARAALLP